MSHLYWLDREHLKRHCQIKLICYGGLRIWVGFENRCLAICQAI